MPITINDLNSIAEELQFRNWSAHKDTVRRLTTFYQDLLMRMYPNHVCRPRVEDLLQLLRHGEEESTYYAAWYEIPVDSKRHIINLANILGVVLPPPRPISALAVGHLQRYYREGDERAINLVNEYLEKAREAGDPQGVGLIGMLAGNREIGLRKREDIADYLYEQLHVPEIPYLAPARPDGGNARQVDNYIIPRNMMIVEGKAKPNSVYAGNEMYQRLVGVFNGTLRVPSVTDSIVQAFNLQGDEKNPARLAIKPLSVIAVNAPDGKRVYRDAIRIRDVPQAFIDQGLQVLLNSGAIEEVGETVRLTNPFKINLVNG